MSNHAIEVVKIDRIESHPNADKLDIIHIWDYSCIVAKGQFKLGELAAYIIPDSIVDTSVPEFEFLKYQDNKTYEHRRIKAKKLRGYWSVGLLIPARSNWKVGDDVSEELKITHYEPELFQGSKNPNAPKLKGLTSSPPKIGNEVVKEYTDIENFRRHGSILDGLIDDVVITEKIHGTNFRAVYVNNKLYVGSHHEWKMGPKDVNKFHKRLLDFSQNKFYRKILAKLIGQRNMTLCAAPMTIYWAVAEKYDLENKLSKYPRVVLYGEVYGRVQKGYPYDATPEDSLKLVIFDIKNDTGNYMDYAIGRQYCENNLGLPYVPVLYKGPYDKEKALALAEGNTVLGNGKHIREGVVVKPVHEQYHMKLGRVILKIVGNRYLNKEAD